MPYKKKSFQKLDRPPKRVKVNLYSHKENGGRNIIAVKTYKEIPDSFVESEDTIYMYFHSDEQKQNLMSITIEK
jgi:hypothetical protein